MTFICMYPVWTILLSVLFGVACGISLVAFTLSCAMNNQDKDEEEEDNYL